MRAKVMTSFNIFIYSTNLGTSLCKPIDCIYFRRKLQNHEAEKLYIFLDKSCAKDECAQLYKAFAAF